MPHETTLISTIVAGVGLAFVLGALANRFRISPIVGYLLAGVRPASSPTRNWRCSWPRSASSC